MDGECTCCICVAFKDNKTYIQPKALNYGLPITVRSSLCVHACASLGEGGTGLDGSSVNILVDTNFPSIRTSRSCSR